MADSSFDIMCKIDAPEVLNAVMQAEKEVTHRFDLKDSNSKIDFNQDANEINFTSNEEYQLTAVKDIFKQKLLARKIMPKVLSFEKMEDALGSTKKQKAKLQAGIPQENAKEIVKDIKSEKFKVQASIQGDSIRITGKKKDDLQAVMTYLREKDYGIHMQFGNYR
ncbi:MAG: YajQ family cyclic di-GMP-binding protein [bacterium]|nr:YajQ family cyclic di-GMP-binding protein [bacterium]